MRESRRPRASHGLAVGGHCRSRPGQFPTDPHLAGKASRFTRFLVSGDTKVAVHGRDPTALSAVRADIERAGGTACLVRGDVTKLSELDAMRRQIEEELGPIEILVANAGGSFTLPGPLEE